MKNRHILFTLFCTIAVVLASSSAWASDDPNMIDAAAMNAKFNQLNQSARDAQEYEQLFKENADKNRPAAPAAGDKPAGQQTADSSEETVGACIGASNAAVSTCGNVQMTGAITTALNAVSGAVSAGDMKKACNASRTLNTIAAGANGWFGFSCKNAVGKCTSSCKTEIADKVAEQKRLNSEAVADPSNAVAIQFKIQAVKDDLVALRAAEGACLGEKDKPIMAMLQAVQNGVGIYSSQACMDAIAAIECKTLAHLRERPECRFELCGPGGRFAGQTECSGFTEINCEAPENFGLPFCVCKANPQDPSCPGNFAGNPGGGGGPGGIDPGGNNGGNGPGGNPFGGGSPFDGGFSDADLRDLALGGPEEDPTFEKDSVNPADGRSNMQAGGAFSPGGGFSGNPENNKRGGAGKGPFDTDILAGPANANGGGFGGGQGAYPFGQGGANEKEKGFNLKDFLPGGKGAQRAIASKEENERNGISGKEGPSNFQKITQQANTIRGRSETINGQ